jgi:hypothetical protein
LKVSPCAKYISSVAIKMHSLLSKLKPSTESCDFISSLGTLPLSGMNCAF